jgi:hypothetical protein
MAHEHYQLHFACPCIKIRTICQRLEESAMADFQSEFASKGKARIRLVVRVVEDSLLRWS